MSEEQVHLTAENVINTDVKDLAKPEEQKPRQITKVELGRLKRAYFTKQHGTVKACGHRFDPSRTPRMTNCSDCWEAYFQTAVDTAAIHDDLLKGGPALLTKKYGKTFTKEFGRFLEKVFDRGQNNNEQPARSDRSSDDQPTQCDCGSEGVCGEVSRGQVSSESSEGA